MFPLLQSWGIHLLTLHLNYCNDVYIIWNPLEKAPIILNQKKKDSVLKYQMSKRIRIFRHDYSAHVCILPEKTSCYLNFSKVVQFFGTSLFQTKIFFSDITTYSVSGSINDVVYNVFLISFRILEKKLLKTFGFSLPCLFIYFVYLFICLYIAYLLSYSIRITHLRIKVFYTTFQKGHVCLT